MFLQSPPPPTNHQNPGLCLAPAGARWRPDASPPPRPGWEEPGVQGRAARPAPTLLLPSWRPHPTCRGDDRGSEEVARPPPTYWRPTRCRALAKDWTRYLPGGGSRGRGWGAQQPVLVREEEGPRLGDSRRPEAWLLAGRGRKASAEAGGRRLCRRSLFLMPAITLSCTPIADKRNIHTEKQGGESGRRPRSSAAAAPDRPPCPRAGFPPRAPRAKWSPTRIPVHKRLSRDDIANGFLCRHGFCKIYFLFLFFFFFFSKNTHTQTRPLLRADSLESEVHPAFRPPGAAALRGPAGFLPIRSSEHPQVSRRGLFHSYPRQAPSGRPRRARCDGLGLIQRWSGRQSPLARV